MIVRIGCDQQSVIISRFPLTLSPFAFAALRSGQALPQGERGFLVSAPETLRLLRPTWLTHDVPLSFAPKLICTFVHAPLADQMG